MPRSGSGPKRSYDLLFHRSVTIAAADAVVSSGMSLDAWEDRKLRVSGTKQQLASACRAKDLKRVEEL